MPGILDNLGKKFNSISPMEYFQFGAGILGQPNNVGLGIQQGLLGASQAREQMEERKRHEALGAAIKDTSLPAELRSLLSALPPDQAGMALAQYMMQSPKQDMKQSADGLWRYVGGERHGQQVFAGQKPKVGGGESSDKLTQGKPFIDPEGNEYPTVFHPRYGNLYKDENGRYAPVPYDWDIAAAKTRQGDLPTPLEDEARTLYSKASTYIQGMNNLYANLRDDAAPTLGGSVAKGVNSLVANVNGVAKALGMGDGGEIVDRDVRNNILSNHYTKYLESLGVTSAKLQASIIMGTYLQSGIIADQYGRALSDVDFKLNLRAMAESAHKDTIEATVAQNMELFWAKMEAEAKFNPYFAPHLPDLRAAFKYGNPSRPTLIQDDSHPLKGLPGFEGIE